MYLLSACCRYSYKINSIIIEWIVDFLKARKFRVRVNGKYSEWHNVTSGIPQGSVLGPLLFIIYINDLMEGYEHSASTYIFADDAKIYRHVQCYEDCKLLQHAITGLQNWSQKWLLSINVQKCCVVSYGRSVDKSIGYTLLDYNNQNIALERKDTIKDLGVWFDEKLLFREHIHDKINKAYMMLGIIKRNFKHLTIPTFILIYKSMVRSHLDYCCPVWAPYKKGDIEALEKVQKRATKILPSLRHLTYADRLRACKLTTLHYRQIRGDMIETYKIVTGKYDKDITPNLIQSNIRITRGNDLRLQKSHFKYDVRKFYFTNRVVDYWNSLPNRVVTANNTNVFKKRLDQYWQHQDIIYDFRAQIEGTGSRSNVSRVNVV